MMRKLVLAAILAGSIGTMATPASAVVYVRVAPPEPYVEVVPEPRRGYTWVEGHWEWRDRRHVWVAGHWGIKQFDGVKWSLWTRPETGSFTALWGAARGDVWAVAEGGIIAHRTGGTWTSQAPERRFTNTRFQDIWGSSASDVWAVGEAGALLRRRK